MYKSGLEKSLSEMPTWDPKYQGYPSMLELNIILDKIGINISIL